MRVRRQKKLRNKLGYNYFYLNLIIKYFFFTITLKNLEFEKCSATKPNLSKNMLNIPEIIDL